MSSDLYFNNVKFISAKATGKISGYSPDYVGQLCRADKLVCQRVGKSWYVKEESLTSYMATVAEQLKNIRELQSSALKQVQVNPAVASVSARPAVKKANPFTIFYTHYLLALPLLLAKLSEGARTHRSLFYTDLIKKTASLAFVFLCGFALAGTATVNASKIAKAPRKAYAAISDINTFYATTFAQTYLSLGETFFDSTRSTLASLEKCGSNPALCITGSVRSVASVESHTTDKAASVTFAFVENTHAKTFSYISDTLAFIGSDEDQSKVYVGKISPVRLIEDSHILAQVAGTPHTVVDKAGVSVYRTVNGWFTKTGDALSTLFSKKTSVIVINPVASTTSSVQTRNNSQITYNPTVIVKNAQQNNTHTQTIIERIVEVPSPAPTDVYVDLQKQITDLSTSINNRFAGLSTGGASTGNAVTNIYQQIAQSQRIDQLSNTTLNNPVIVGGSISGITLNTSQINFASGFSAGTTTLTNLIVSNTSTSTFAGGIDLGSGCVAINGTCITGGGGGGGSGTVGSGTTGQIPYYAANGTAVSATSSLNIAPSGLVTIGLFNTTAATSTNLYALNLTGTNITAGSITATSTATSTFTGGIATNLLNVTSTIASSTFANGINLTSGCFSVGGVCVTGGGAGTITLGAQYSTGQTGSSQTFATSSDTNIGLTIVSSGDIHTFTPVWSGVLSVLRGGTGISSPTGAGVLLGNYAGTGYMQIATSSLGLLSTDIAEGSNLYYLDSRVQSFIHSSTTIPKTYTDNTFVGTNIFNSSVTIGSLNGPLQANNGLVSATTSISQLYGGTGITSYTAGDILYANNSGILTKLAVGGDGLVLKINAGLPSWQTDLSSGGGGGSTAWSTTTNSMIIYPTDTTDILVVGSNATTTTGNTFEVAGNSLFGGNISIGSTTPFAKLSINSVAGSPAFVVGSSTATSFIVDKNGNVGVGTSSPVAPFAVEGQSLAQYFTGISTTATSTLAGGLAIETSGLVYDFSSGKVGIGTASPTRALSVSGAIRSSGSTNAIYLDYSGNERIFVAVDTNSNANFSLAADAGAFRFANFTGNERMRITGGGYVGIATSAPQYQLTIASSTAPQLSLSAGAGLGQWIFRNAGGNLYFATTTVAGTATTSISALSIDGTTGGISLATSTAGILKISSAGLIWSDSATQTGASTTLLADFNTFSNTNNFTGKLGLASSSPWAKLSVNSIAGEPAFVVGSSTATSLIVSANGNVGVGIANPGYILDVNGSFRSTVGSNSFFNDGALSSSGSYSNNDYFLSIRNSAGNLARTSFTQNGIVSSSGGSLIWTNTTTSDGLTSTYDTGLSRGAAGKLYVGNGTAGTFTGTLITGNIGIGTTSPFAKLSIAGTDTSTTLIGADALSGFTGNLIDIKVASTTIFSVSGSGFGTTTVSGLNISGQATTTSNVGINITTGCFAVNGGCLTNNTAVGTVNSGTAGQFPYYAGSGTTLTATSSLYVSTSGNIGIGTQTPTSGVLQIRAKSTDNAALVVDSGPDSNPWAIQFARDGLSSAYVYMQSNATLGFQATLNPFADDDTSQTLGTPSKRWNALNIGTGASSFGGALGVTGATTLSSTLGVTGQTSLRQASTTGLSAGFAYFGTTATSSFSNTGVLTLASALAVTSGGTGATSFAPNSIVTSNAAGTALIATGTQLTVGNILATTTATSTLPRLLATNATTTSFAVTGITSSLLKTDANGSVIPAVLGTDYQTFAFPFTSVAGYNSTSTTIGFTNGLFSTASSTFSGPLRLPSLSDGALAVYSGLVSSGATTTAGTGLTYSGNAFNINTSQSISTLSNLTTNGIVTTSGGTGALSVTTNGTNGTVLAMSGGVPAWVATTTAGTGLSYNGTSFLLNTANANTWSALQTFNYSSSTIYSSFLNASTTNLIVNGELFNDLTGTGLQLSGGALTLNTTGDWTGTIDGNNFAGGAIGTGELLYGASAGSITELPVSTNGFVLALSNGIPAWVATTTLSTISGTLPVSKGGTNATSFAPNSIIVSDSAGTTLIATGTQLTVGNIIATTTATSYFLGNVGIGTTSPVEKFVVAGGNAVIEGSNSVSLSLNRLGTNFDNYLNFKTNLVSDATVGLENTTGNFLITGPSSTITRLSAGNSATLNLSAGASSIITFSVNNAERARFDTNGNLGIGTTSPFAKLSIAGTDTTTTLVAADALSGFTGNLIDLKLASTTKFSVSGTGFATTTVSGLNISASATTTSNVGINIATGCFSVNGSCLTNSTAVGTVNSGTAGQFPYYAGSGTTLTATSSLYVSTSGNIGIGTQTPTSGVLQIRAKSTDNAALVVDSGPDSNPWAIQFARDGLSSAYVYMQSNATLGFQATLNPFADDDTSQTLGTPSKRWNALNIGTGVSSFGGNLSVTGTLGVTGQATLRQASSTLLSANTGYFNNIFATSTTQFSGFGATTTPFAQLSINSVAGSPAFVVGSSTATSLIVAANGNVGVGTTNPTGKFMVQSSTGFFSMVNDAQGMILTTGITGTTRVTIGSGGDITLNHPSAVPVISSSNATGVLTVRGGTGASAGLTLRGTSNSTGGTVIIAPNANTTYMTMTGAGIGIGTSTIRYMLNVASSTVPQLTLSGADSDNPWTFRSVSGALYIATSSPLTFATSSATALTIDVNGNMGVATSSPWRTFAVTGTAAFSGLTAAASGDSAICLSSGGELRVNTGVQTCTVSSAQFKHNIATSTINALDLINAMRPANYVYNNDESNSEHFGFIAEEVDLLEPRLVARDTEGGIRSFRYEEFTSVLAKGIQEMDINLKALDARVTALEMTAASSTSSGIVFSEVLSNLEALGARFVNGIAYFKNIFAETLTIGTAEKPTGITLYDEDTGEPYCLKMKSGAAVSFVGTCTTATSTPPTTVPSTDIVAPVISLMGNNPAEITIGTSYVDLGATVTDMGINPLDPSGPLIQNNNLGIHYFVSGGVTNASSTEVTNISLDTSTTTSYTIIFKAIDASGNTGEATRVVNVIPMQ